MRTPGSGRKPGSLNKDKSQCQELAERLGVNPFQILLHIAAGDWVSLGYTQQMIIGLDIRVKAAAEASKYLYSQRKALEVTAPEPIQVIIEDYTK